MRGDHHMITPQMLADAKARRPYFVLAPSFWGDQYCGCPLTLLVVDKEGQTEDEFEIGDDESGLAYEKYVAELLGVTLGYVCGFCDAFDNIPMYKEENADLPGYEEGSRDGAAVWREWKDCPTLEQLQVQ